LKKIQIDRSSYIMCLQIHYVTKLQLKRHYVTTIKKATSILKCPLFNIRTIVFTKLYQRHSMLIQTFSSYWIHMQLQHIGLPI